MNAPDTHPQNRPYGAHKPSASLARVLARIPENVRDGFTAEQLAALDGALDINGPNRHSINIRLTLFDWAYFVVLGGREARKPRRQVKERERHPLNSPGNIAFLTGVGIMGLALGNTLHWLLIGG